MKKIICYSLIFLFVIVLSLFINIKTCDKIVVHASGPKQFEVGDVLPATTNLRIYWTLAGDIIPSSYFGIPGSQSIVFYIKASSKTIVRVENYSFNIYISINSIYIYKSIDNHWQSPFTKFGGGHAYIDINTSNWTEQERTISMIDSELIDIFTWEDLNAPSGYTITFNSNGGSTIPDIEDATELPTLPIPTKSGYTFAGWYYDDDFTTQAYAEDELEDDVTLYAKWILNTYTITYNSNGGSSIPQTSDVTQLPDSLPIPTKSGYTFDGWYYDSTFTQIATAGDTIESDVTLYAKWELNTYTITFEENGGSTVTDLTEQTALPDPLPTPTRTGYYFQGWFYDSDFTSEALAGDSLSTDVTLYAMWTQYNRIFFNTNGGNTIPSIITTDIIPDNLPIPVRNDDIFIGWYYDESLSVPVETNDILSSNITLYASWIDYDGIIEYFYDIYKDGYDGGYDDTYEDAFNQGYELGFEYGYPYGYDDGYRDGLMEDHRIVFQEYFDKGYFDARDKYGKLIDDYQWESAQIAYENGQKTMGRYSKILMYGIVIITIIGGVLLYFSLKRRNG